MHHLIKTMIQLVILLLIDLILANIYQGDMVLSSYVTNIISHTILSFMSILVFFVISDLEPIDIDRVGAYEVFCGRWLVWYLVMDVAKMFLGISKYDNVYAVHHVFAIVLVESIIRFEMLHYYLPVICIFEISSIPLNIRYALRHVGTERASLIYTEFVFFILFVTVRLWFGFKKAFEAISMLIELENDKWVFIGIVVTTVAIFALLHVVWTVGILRRLLITMSLYNKNKSN